MLNSTRIQCLALEGVDIQNVPSIIDLAFEKYSNISQIQSLPVTVSLPCPLLNQLYFLREHFLLENVATSP